MTKILDISGSVGMPGVNIGAVDAGLAAALLLHGTMPAEGARFDSDGNVDVNSDALDLYNRHMDERFVAEIEQQFGVRGDAMPDGLGGFPRDFEHAKAGILEQKRKPLNFNRLFPVLTDVPLGATSFTARREVATGEADFHRGGSNVPLAQARYNEERFNVRYIVCGVRVNYFQALSSGFAGLNQFQRDSRTALRAIDEKLNATNWRGNTALGLHGVLTYPELAKMAMRVPHTAASDPKDIARDLLDLLGRPMVDSGGIYTPDSLVCSERLYRLYHETKYESAGGTDTTIAQWVRKARPNGVENITFEMANELKDFGGEGVDGVFAYTDDADAIAHQLVSPPMPLPIYQSGPFDQMVVWVAATGGTVMHDVGAHLLGLAVAR